MSRQSQNITAKKGARSTTGLTLGVVSPGLTLAKRPSESHHIEDYTHFIRTLARELARADHAAED